MRKTKLDELPQLVNIIKGDMRFIGPRPEIPEYVVREKFIFLNKLKPGLSGYSSILFRNESEIMSLIDNENPYDDILKIPNVTLIHPDYDSKTLFENCSLVSTIAGSSGFEAAFYEKASIIFSDVLYDCLPSVFKVKTPEYLPKIIRQALECKVQASDLDKFIVFLEKNSINFDLYDYETKQLNLFAYGGQYLDVPISEEKVKSFLEEDESLIKNFVDAHLEKIQKFEEKND